MDQRKSQEVEGSREGAGCYVIERSHSRVRDIPERLRPREELARLGVENVSDDVLLAIILRSGVRGRSVVDLSRDLLQTYGSLGGIAGSSVDELAGIHGMGPVKAQVLMVAFEMSRRMAEEAEPARRAIRTPRDAADLLFPKARTLDRELFWVLLLDTKNRLKGKPVEVSSGLLDASLVHPREVFREAIRSAAAAVVLVHNHPSGDAAPSNEDICVTRQLVEAGRVIDIKVLDHIVLGRRSAAGDGYLSMRESGSVTFN